MKKHEISKAVEVYCQHITLGKGKFDSYCATFPGKQHGSGARSQATKWHQRDDVQTRLNELKTIDSIATARGIWSKEDRLRMLEDIAKDSYKPGDVVSLKLCIQAIDAAAKIAGDHVQKLQIEDSRVNYSFNVLQSLANTIEGEIVASQNNLLE